MSNGPVGMAIDAMDVLRPIRLSCARASWQYLGVVSDTCWPKAVCFNAEEMLGDRNFCYVAQHRSPQVRIGQVGIRKEALDVPLFPGCGGFVLGPGLSGYDLE